MGLSFCGCKRKYNTAGSCALSYEIIVDIGASEAGGGQGKRQRVSIDTFYIRSEVFGCLCIWSDRKTAEIEKQIKALRGCD